MRPITRMGLSAACVLSILTVHMGCGRDSQKKSVAAEPRNLVIIVSDALRRDVLGCYGGPVHTPNIDRLAREGTLFENAYSTAPCTMPSSVAMMTGNYARSYTFNHNVRYQKDLGREKKGYFFRVGEGARMFAESLTQAGYKTRAAVENGLVKRSNLLQGYTLCLQSDRMSRESLDRLERELGFRMLNQAYGKQAGMLDFLLNMPADQAFAAFIWIYDPHGPYDPPETFRKRIPIDPGDLPRPLTFYTSAKQKQLRGMTLSGELNPLEIRYLRGLYEAEVASMDQRVGYVLKALEKSGQLDSTLIVFTSDHGECLGDHRHFGHARAIFQELVRVPLIFRGPGISPGRKVNHILSHLDLKPTLSEIMGIDANARTQGRSYAAALRGEKIARRFLYFDWFSNSLNKDWAGVDGAMDFPIKLIVKRNGEDYTYTLYDLSVDPGEAKDLAGENPLEVKRIFARILQLRRSNRDLLETHIRQLGAKLDPAEEVRRTKEKLKSLGYL